MTCVHHAIPQPAICEVCAREAASGRRVRRGILLAVVLLAPIAAAVGYLQTRPKAPPPPKQEADNVLRLQEEALKLHPCDAQMLTERVERFATLERVPEALATARYAVGCGLRGRMPWRVAYLEQQLHQWLPTVVTTTELLTEAPDDSDFWWWRADAWMDAKLPKLAVFDLRQSLANSDGAQAGGFAAARFLDAGRAGDAMCEADRGWRYFVHVLGGSPNQDMRDEHAALVRAKTCDDTTGHGVVPARARVTIAGTTGTFSIDPRLGTTLISRDFAAKAALDSDATLLGIAYVGASGVQLGEPLRVTIAAGPVTAGTVDAFVTDNLPEPGVDGVLGLSFLWHFAFEPTPAGFAVRPLDHDPI
jgi:hypothetical protein